MIGTPAFAAVAGALVIGTQMLATDAGGVWCVTRKRQSRVPARGRLRRPRYPSRGLSKVGGVLCALACQRTPRRCVPPTAASRRRPRGQPRAASPSDSSLPGAVRKTGVVSSYLYKSLAACACLTLTRSAALAALMLALRSLNAREHHGRFCAVLNSRRKVAYVRLRARRLPPRIIEQPRVVGNSLLPRTGACKLT